MTTFIVTENARHPQDTATARFDWSRVWSESRTASSSMLGGRLIDPVISIERLKAERSGRADSAILDELRTLEPLPDEDDERWNQDETWSRAYLLIALADLLAARRLETGVGLVLDKMCLGDPGETMRGLRHSLEAAASPNWSRLAEACVARCSSERAGTRYWAVDELGVLRDPATLPTILQVFDDHEHDVAVAAFRSSAMLVGREPGLRARVIRELRGAGRRRSSLRAEAEAALREIRCAVLHGETSTVRGWKPSSCERSAHIVAVAALKQRSHLGSGVCCRRVLGVAKSGMALVYLMVLSTSRQQ